MARDTSTVAPAGAPRPRNRLVLDVALAVVVVAWLATLAIVVVRRGDRDAETPATAEVPPRAEPPTAAEIRDQLEVETGFTPGEVVTCVDPAAERCAPEDRRAVREAVAYAIVVENTSDYVVRDLQLSYRFVDASGAVVRESARYDADDVPDAEGASIPEIRAGESSAVGGTLYPESNDVAEVEVELDVVGELLPADYYEHTDEARTYDGDLDVTGIEVGYGTVNEPVVTFTVESGRVEPAAPPYAYVVFRDGDGAIVGGTAGEVGGPGSRLIPAGGSIEGEVGGPMEIPGIDPSRTDVYLSSSYPS